MTTMMTDATGVMSYRLTDDPGEFSPRQVWRRRRDGRLFEIVRVHDGQAEIAEFPELDHRDMIRLGDVHDHFQFVGQVQS